jgi:hypothetical protein
MNGAGALCEEEGEALRRALTVAFADEAQAGRRAAAAFASLRRRWRAAALLGDPLGWVDVVAVRGARRWLAAQERRWRPADPGVGFPADPLAPLRPRARVAVVLHALRGRSLDDVATALDLSRAAAASLLQDAYRCLGVVDPDVADDAVPYAG